MRSTRLALGLLAFLAILTSGPSAFSQGPIVGPGQPILCGKAATMAVGPTSSTLLVAGVAGQGINVCGWHITNTGASGTFTFTIGTGATCGTNTVTVVPAMSITNTAPVTDHIDYAFLSVPAGVSLCITPSVATIAAVIYYTQF